MIGYGGAAPKVSLSRSERWRLIIVGLFVIFAVARVVPDIIRVTAPLGLFAYVTDSDGVVTEVGASDGGELRVGDRVRLDRIRPFDRKPGLVRTPYTREDFDRYLPIERNGVEQIVHLKAKPETTASLAALILRVSLFLISVCFGAMLVIIKPNVATIAFFLFCLGGDYPTTYSAVFWDNPWRQYPQWIGDTLRGFGPVGLCLFALCFVFSKPRAQWILAAVCGVAGLAIGTASAYATWRLTYAALPAQFITRAVYDAFAAVDVIAGLAFVVAFVRSRGAERQRTGWIIAAFALAIGARFLSQRLFPETINYWENGILLSLTAVPVLVVWIAVVRHHFFNVDFVVSRGLVYAAIGAAFFGALGISEEIASYVFYNNTELANTIAYAIIFVFGLFMSKFNDILHPLVDRFVFPARRAQRKQLERVAMNILESTSVDEVYSALLLDVASVLDLSFGGIMVRDESGGFKLVRSHDWPAGFVEHLPRDHPLVVELDKTRGVTTFDDSGGALIKRSFPNERLTFVAPLLYDRTVGGLVLYGHSISGVDIDPDERTLLLGVIGHASVTLGAIELAKYREVAELFGKGIIIAAPEA